MTNEQLAEDLRRNGYVSQCWQDVFIAELFSHKTGGVFVDIGAHDGVEISNTLFLERNLGWTGLCVEPNPESFSRLKRNRQCKVVNVAAGDRSVDQKEFCCGTGDLEMLSACKDVFDAERFNRFKQHIGGGLTEIVVGQRKTQDILDEFGITHIDYLSVDTDGSDLSVLIGIDWGKTAVMSATIEDINMDRRLSDFMHEQGLTKSHRIAWDTAFWRPEIE